MPRLDRRLEALEAATVGMPDIVIIHNIVTPGRLDAPLRFASIDGRQHDIGQGETQDAYRQRVREAAREHRRLSGRHPLVLMSSEIADVRGQHGNT
jgi:hypothetical protein